MDPFFNAFSDLLDSPTVSYSHKWEEGDVVGLSKLNSVHPEIERLVSALAPIK
jgi:hypothetical protein